MSDGCWSPARPAVFAVSRVDGTLVIWDLMFKHTRPSATYKVPMELFLSIDDHLFYMFFFTIIGKVR